MEGSQRPASRGVWSAQDGVSYWLIIGSVYLAQLALWYFSAKGKVLDGSFSAPEGIVAQFDGSFIASFPGTDVAWGMLGIVEALAFLCVVASLVMGEFLPGRAKPVLQTALGVGIVSFALMIFGSSMTSSHESVASLYTYFGATLVMLFYVRYLASPRKED